MPSHYANKAKKTGSKKIQRPSKPRGVNMKKGKYCK